MTAEAKARSSGSARPLEGVRVLDLSRLLPGPFATLVLGDLGAEVDKVEDMAGGDYLRVMPPLVSGTSATFLALNRNKRSLCLDLKRPAAREAFLRLVPRYDVLVDPFRPGVLARLGLGHDALTAANPRLVVCALTGYGQDGPLAHRAGHDIDYLARAGVLGMQGPAGGPPAVPGFQLADVGGALWSVIGVLSALAARERTGQGTVVDVSMMEASMGFAIAGFGPVLAGASHARGDELLTGGLALYRTYETKEGGPVALGALEPKFAAAFLSAVGLPFDGTALAPGPHQAQLSAQLSALFLSRTRAEWERFALAHDVCLEPVLAPGAVLTDPHAEARGIFFDLPSPWGVLRQMRLPVTPRGATHRPPPHQGEHTRAILGEAGLDDDAIDALIRAGAAHQHAP